MHPAAFDRDFLCQTAAAAAQADKVHVFGQMVIAAFARWHIVADDVGLNHHVLPHLNIGNAFAHGIHHTRKFVPHGNGRGFARNGMRMAARRNKNRAFHKFVQVGAADAAPSHLDADCARGNGGFGDVFNANIAFVVETCCFHLCLLLFGRLE